MSRPILGVTHTIPTVAVPHGACDCHVHVFAPEERFPWAETRVYTPPPAPLEALEALHRRLGIDRVVIVQPTPYGTDNSCLLDTLRRLGDRARGIAVIDDRTSDAALGEMDHAGVRGVRVNLATHGENDPAKALTLLRRAAARVAPLGWHVQLFTDLSVIAALHEVIAELPVPVVIDHFGGAKGALGPTQQGFAALLALVRDGTAYVKISAAYRLSDIDDYADVAPLARTLIDANPERIVWGTDWPHPATRRGPRVKEAIEPLRPEDDGRALDRLTRWTTGAAERERILVANPQILYGFPVA